MQFEPLTIYDWQEVRAGLDVCNGVFLEGRFLDGVAERAYVGPVELVAADVVGLEAPLLDDPTLIFSASHWGYTYVGRTGRLVELDGDLKASRYQLDRPVDPRAAVRLKLIPTVAVAKALMQPMLLDVDLNDDKQVVEVARVLSAAWAECSTSDDSATVLDCVREHLGDLRYLETGYWTLADREFPARGRVLLDGFRRRVVMEDGRVQLEDFWGIVTDLYLTLDAFFFRQLLASFIACHGEHWPQDISLKARGFKSLPFSKTHIGVRAFFMRDDGELALRRDDGHVIATRPS